MDTSNSSIANISYDLLHFRETAIKNDFNRGGKGYQWASDNIEYLYQDAQPFISKDKITRARMMELGEINAGEYKKIIDPIDESDSSGGKAEFFYSDWKSNPCYLHLNRIIDAKLKKLESNIIIRAADELSKSKRQIENERIMNKDIVREIFNDMLIQMNLPSIRKDEDPYQFVEKMKKASDKNEKKANKLFSKEGNAQALDDTVMNDIVNSIFDNEGLALYQEYIYRTDSEIAVEIGIKYYQAINKWNIIKDKIIKDLRNFNAYAFRFYTSQTTGTPQIESVDFNGDNFRVLPFSRNDGMDCTGMLHEKDVTFGTFVRMFGANLSKDELKEIFNVTRGLMGASHTTYDLCTNSQRESSKIRIGYAEWESQNIEVYREGDNNYGNFDFRKKDVKYKPPRGKNYKRSELHLNVWYKCYYIPVATAASFTMDAKRVFDYGLLQDQQRFGEDGRLSKSSYVLFKDASIPSMNEIISRYMRLINIEWFHIQNEIANDHPTIQIMTKEALSSMMSNIDDDQKKGKDATKNTIRMVKQKGIAIVNSFDKNNQRIDVPIHDLKSSHVLAAQERLVLIGDLYNQLTMSIGINDVTEGIDPKPRQALGGIEMANEASNSSRYFLEEAMVNCNIELGYRFLYYFFEIVNSGDADRISDLESIVGTTNMKALSGIKDIPFHRLGIYVDNINTDQLKQMILDMALNEYKKGMLPPQDYLFLLSCENIKVAVAVLRLKLKKREKEMQDMKQQDFQQQQQAQQNAMDMQGKMKQLDTMMKEHTIKVQALEDRQTEILKEKLQTLGAVEVKKEIRESKKEEIILQHQLEEQSTLI